MKILAIVSGEYGRRHVGNIRAHGPTDWEVETWQAPTVLPPVVDYPEDYLPEAFDAADLILALGEHRGIIELVPDIARMSRAAAVIAPVDREEWLPRGLARQLRGWLGDIGVACVTPKPFCSLTETEYGVQRRQRLAYDHLLIQQFAQFFGRPQLRITVDERAHAVCSVKVLRDACCGCARFVARELVGVDAAEASEKAGLLHHHYPCLASMGIDPDFGDTLLHVSGNILKDEVSDQIRPHVTVGYIRPGQRAQ